MYRVVSPSFWVALATFLFALSAAAVVPPPPVNQDLGMPDLGFNSLEEGDCRVCHDSGLPDRHHLNNGQTLPLGDCRYTVETCRSDDACGFDGRCQGSTGTSCTVDLDCLLVDVGACTGGFCRDGITVCADDTECPLLDEGPCINRNYCVGEPDTPYDTGDPDLYDCLDCHSMVWDGSAWVMGTFRDCTLCHAVQGQPLYPYRAQSPNKHHVTEGAHAGDCKSCHGSFVDLGYANAVQPVPWIPTYDPSLVTPWPSGKPNAGPNGEGNCNFCHDAGIDGTLSIIDNHDTHHGTGLTHGIEPVDLGSCTAGLCRDGIAACTVDADCPPLVSGCLACHDAGFYSTRENNALSIRTCEVCHGIPSLHNIAVDSNGDSVIEPGAEPAGYSHIGSNDDCDGCHGFTSATTPFFAASVPDVGGISCVPGSGNDRVCTVTGINFVDANTYWGLIEAKLALLGADGSLIIDDDSTATQTQVVGTIPKGAAKTVDQIVVVKQNPDGVVLVQSPLLTQGNWPGVVVDGAECRGGVIEVLGGDFGSYAPAPASGPEGPTPTSLLCEIAKKAKGRPTVTLEYAAVVSWTGSAIVAETSECPSSCSLSSVWGDAEFEVQRRKGGGKEK